jgi:nucleoside-diphosphate-sugar epimerase
MFSNVYQGKRVFITGHTGFKGSWLAAWLHGLGADVTGWIAHDPDEIERHSPSESPIPYNWALVKR